MYRVIDNMSDYMDEMYSGYEDNVVLTTGGVDFISSHIEEFLPAEENSTRNY